MEYYLHRDGQQWGPYDEATLLSMLAAQQVLPTDLIWNDQMPDWATVESVFPTSAPAPIPAPAPPKVGMPAAASPVAAGGRATASPQAAAGKSTVKPAKQPNTEATPGKSDPGKKSNLPRIAAAVAVLCIAGIIVWWHGKSDGDSVIEAAIRKELKKPDGELTQTDFMKLKRLSLYGQTEKAQDISSVAELRNLEELEFGGGNISDLSPLAKLTNLDSLQIGGCGIEDISHLSKLTSLRVLIAGDNNIKDISSLKGLHKLESVSLSNNQITDPSPLSGLTLLKQLNLQGNPISNTEIESLKKALPKCAIQHDS